MTAMTDSTNTHTANLDLADGTYNYYVKCQDANHNTNSTARQITFTIDTSVSSPQLKTDDNNYDKPSKETNYVNDKDQKFKGEDSALANGQVKIYKNSKLYKTITANATGAWSTTVKKLKTKSQTLKFKFYDQNSNLLDTFKRIFKVDNENPIFTSFINLRQVAIPGITKYTWTATDNHKISQYKIYFNGKIKQSKTPSFLIPTGTPRGWHNLKIKAIDKAGNETTQDGDVWVR